MHCTHQPSQQQPMKRSRRRSSSLSRTEDLSRLLDPSYLPSSSSTSSSPVSVHAWVDDHGDLHDPDYRDFPILAPPTARRPAWERSSNADAADEEETQPLTTPRPVSPRERRRARYDAEYAALAPKPVSYASTSTCASSTSHDNDLPAPPSPRRRKLRRASLDYAPEHAEFDEPAFSTWHDELPAFEEPNREQEKEYAPSHARSDWTPTCSQSLRRQWQAFTLGVRFSLFRAQRRIHRRMSAT